MREWLEHRRLERELADIRESFLPRERAARTDDDRQAINAEWSAEAEWPEDEVQALNTKRLRRLARRWDVDMPGFGGDAWIVDDPRTGHSYLQPPEQTKLQRQIRLARRESIRWWIQTVAMPLIALSGVAVGLVSLLLSWYRLGAR